MFKSRGIHSKIINNDCSIHCYEVNYRMIRKLYRGGVTETRETTIASPAIRHRGFKRAWERPTALT